MKVNHARVLIRVLILAATTVAVIGFTITSKYIFVIAPPLAVAALWLLLRYAGPPVTVQESQKRNSARKRIFFQLMLSLCILAGLLTYSIVDYQRRNVIGYAILLAELGVLILLAIFEYIRNRDRLAAPPDD
jgi:hypothetical protein